MMHPRFIFGLGIALSAAFVLSVFIAGGAQTFFPDQHVLDLAVQTATPTSAPSTARQFGVVAPNVSASASADQIPDSVRVFVDTFYAAAAAEDVPHLGLLFAPDVDPALVAKRQHLFASNAVLTAKPVSHTISAMRLLPNHNVAVDVAEDRVSLPNAIETIHVTTTLELQSVQSEAGTWWVVRYTLPGQTDKYGAWFSN